MFVLSCENLENFIWYSFDTVGIVRVVLPSVVVTEGLMFMFVPKHVSLSDCCFVGKIVSRRMRNPASLKGGKPEVDLMRNEH